MAVASTSLIAVVPSSDWASLAEVGEECPSFSHPGYLFTNESYGSTARTVISALSRFHGGFYFGVSGWENYSYILSCKPVVALLADFSENVVRIHRLTQKCLLQASNRQEFVDLFKKEISKSDIIIPNIKYKSDPSSDPFSGFEQEFADSTSWLGSDTSYEQIRRYFAEGRIVCLRRRLGKNDFFAKLNEWLDARGLSRRVVYLSNALDWISIYEKHNEDQQMEFIRTYIAPALNKSSLVIDSRHNLRFVAKYQPSTTYLNALVYRGLAFAAGDLSFPIVEIGLDDEDEKESVQNLPDDPSHGDGDALDALAEAGLLDL